MGRQSYGSPMESMGYAFHRLGHASLGLLPSRIPVDDMVPIDQVKAGRAKCLGASNITAAQLEARVHCTRVDRVWPESGLEVFGFCW